jgi:hypothetical protein
VSSRIALPRHVQTIVGNTASFDFNLILKRSVPQ